MGVTEGAVAGGEVAAAEAEGAAEIAVVATRVPMELLSALFRPLCRQPTRSVIHGRSKSGCLVYLRYVSQSYRWPSHYETFFCRAPVPFIGLASRSSGMDALE